MKEPRRQTELPRFGQPRRRGRARRDPLPPSLRPRPARAELVAEGRWGGSRRSAELPWGEVASLLVHAALLALLLWQGQGGRMDEVAESPPAVDIVFETGQPEPRATGAREGEDPTATEPESAAQAPPPAPEAPRTVEAPPPPDSPPVPPRPLAPPPVPLPPRVATAPPPPAPPAAPPPPEPELAELPPRPVEPQPRLSAEIPPPAELLGPQVPLAINPPRITAAPRPTPAPRPEPRPRPQQQAQPSSRLPGLYLPEGPSFTTPQPRPGRPDGNRQRLDLAVSPRLLEGRTSPDPTVRVRGAQVGPDWNGAFRRWLDQHLHYPIRAIEAGDAGTVRVVVTARPDGTVTGVRLTGPSASPFLNSGTTFPFAGARLPAFPPGSNPDGVEVDLTVQYILIRR